MDVNEENMKITSSPKQEVELAIEVRRIMFSYTKRKNEEGLLKDVNMSVPTSSIYGLLGPSGCGKTTLLRLIAGRLKPNSGTINVFGIKPNDSKGMIPGPGIGFMPQELALYDELTISESLNFFANIYCMENQKTQERIKFLVQFLDLPDPNRLIKNLSGGQKRRVSVAVSLIHSPPLLILDEPTVGVDPLLRERIWQYLVTLTQRDKMTVVITTHYIEEARSAHTVALMREGRLLIEHTPDYLMSHFGATNLEDVFLSVCRQEQTELKQIANHLQIGKNESNNKLNDDKMPTFKMISSDSQNFSDAEQGCSTINLVESNERITNGESVKFVESQSVSGKLFPLIRKNVIRIRRNIPLLLFNLGNPTLQIILFCICIGTMPYDLQMAVYNPEATDNSSLSSLFIDSIDKTTIIIKNYDSKESAINSVKDDETWGALIFDKQFSTYIFKRFLDVQKADDETIEKSSIQYYGDTTNIEILNVIQKALLEANIKFMHRAIQEANKIPGFNVSERIADPLIQFHEPPVYGDSDADFREFMAPGMLLTISYVLALGLTAVSFVIERKEGMYERIMIAGVLPYQIIIAHFVIQSIILICQTALLLIFTFLVFQIPNKGPIYLAILLVILQGLAGMSFGFVISSICNNEQTAIMLSLATFYPALTVSGVMWPLEGMHKVLRSISYFLPQTLAIRSLRNIMLRGWGISYFSVYIGFISTTTWIIIYLSLTTILFSLKK